MKNSRDLLDISAPRTFDFQVKNVESTIPKKRQELLNWSGWGYKDTKFYAIKDEIYFKGPRYPAIKSGVPLTAVKNWMQSKFQVSIEDFDQNTPKLPTNFPQPKLCQDFMEGIKNLDIDYSTDGEDRLIRCHGQTFKDIYMLRSGKFNRIPDLVLWPKNHNEVVQMVELANNYEIVLIPYGGGTNVSEAVTCPQNETERSIAVVDTSQMNRLLWLDKSSLVACFEAGIVGQDMERVLALEGLTTGHEPDSYEVSTLGGWVATRASGMKKNLYGNIEDLVTQMKMVTCQGVLERSTCGPRVSCGPDFNHIILGSEGSLGIVTEVVIKVRPLPQVKKYGSLVFPDFGSGVRCLREIAKRKCQPASLRLMDNEQFMVGQALKVDDGFFSHISKWLKNFALTAIKGFDMETLSVATLLFEGDKEYVDRQEKLVNEIAGRHAGFAAGSSNGKDGYVFTFVVAYIRDIALDYGIASESLETSVPWDKIEKLCVNVKAVVSEQFQQLNIAQFLVSYRVTQVYDVGACVYFYLSFRYDAQSDPMEMYEIIQGKARNEILASGGSISHHHGIGKLQAQWYKQSISSVGVDLFKSTKRSLDPKNIFATGNFLAPEDAIEVGQAKCKL